MIAVASTVLVALVWIIVVRPPLGLIVYNVPIMLPFFALGWEVLSARRWRRDAGVFFVWALGGALLAARFAGAVPVSGHVTWCVLMAAHIRLRGAPRWVAVALALVAAETLLFKILWRSWLDTALGLVAGAVLAYLLTRVSRTTGNAPPGRNSTRTGS